MVNSSDFSIVNLQAATGSAGKVSPDTVVSGTTSKSLKNPLQLASEVLNAEANALLAIEKRLDANFEHALELMLNCSGKVVVTGMGKSGHIANKLAATFASTGTPAFFVHPAELRHGEP